MISRVNAKTDVLCTTKRKRTLFFKESTLWPAVSPSFVSLNVLYMRPDTTV
jgi:hypothetical protein